MLSSCNFITKEASTSMLVVVMLLVAIPLLTIAQLRTDFYVKTCPNVSAIVRSMVKEAMRSDPTITAGLLRQQYHDCFVNGCDASNLLDDSDNIKSERNSIMMAHARGFPVVDNIKFAIEASCPGVVSCADIIALMAEASVSLSGGPSWNVALGRRDGLTASPEKADTDLIASFSNFSTLASKFAKKGLNLSDLVALSGGHSLGHSHCTTIKSRLYGYVPKGSPKLNESYLATLQKVCPRIADANLVTDLDSSLTKFDNSYFRNLLANKGIMITDQDLYSTSVPYTMDIVEKFSRNQSMFFEHFVHSMMKMGNIFI